MDTNDSKAIVRRYLEEIVSGGNLGLGADLIGEDVVFVSPYTPEPITGRAGRPRIGRRSVLDPEAGGVSRADRAAHHPAKRGGPLQAMSRR